MKIKLNLLLFIFLALIPYVHLATDACSAGMRRVDFNSSVTYRYGSTASSPLMLATRQGNSAIWYGRNMMYEPRFEVHLKVSLPRSPGTQFDGFTIVLSKARQSVASSASEYLGYYGFTNCYVTEFDFNKNGFDPDTDSYSFKYCKSGCTNDDSTALVSGKLPNQRYDSSRDMTWDFRLIYVDRVLKVYSGADVELFSYSGKLFEESNYLLYLGFTTYLKGTRNLSIQGTFACEDDPYMPKSYPRFYVNSKDYEEYTYDPGSKLVYLFTWNNIKGQRLPHCKTQNVFSWHLTVYVDCFQSGYIKEDGDYNFYVDMTCCTTVGRYPMAVDEESRGEGKTIYFNIRAGPLFRIWFFGHDGITGFTGGYDAKGDLNIKHGTAYGGNFRYKSDLKIVLDFQTYDQWNNTVDVGNTSATIIAKTLLSFSGADGTKMTAAKVGDHYQLTIMPSKVGEYAVIKNKYMQWAIKFLVVAGEISTATSSCTLEGYSSSPIIKQGTTVKYICTLKDAVGNVISFEDFLYGYEYSCKLIRTTPSALEQKLGYSQGTGGYISTYQANRMGDYSVHGYVNKKGSSTLQELAHTINTFYVEPYPTYLHNGKLLNTATNTWISIDSSSITLNYKTNTAGFFTAVDLVDSNGETLMSTAKTYPSDFSVSAKVTANITNPHDKAYTFPALTTKIYTLNGIQYVGIYTASGQSTDTIIKKSSYQYILSIMFNGELRQIIINYVFNPQSSIGSMVTCFHDFDVTKTYLAWAYNTQIDGKNSFQFTKDNDYVKIADMRLRTKDSLLWNYFLDQGDLTVTTDPTSTGLKFKFTQEAIYGTYTVYAMTTTRFDKATLYVKVKGTTVGTLTITSKSPKAYYLEPLDPTLFTQVSEFEYKLKGNTEEFGYQFKLYDQNHKLIDEPDYFATEADIYSIPTGSDSTKNYVLTYDSTTKAYKFQEKLTTISGDVQWVFTMSPSYNRKYTFKADRLGKDFSTDKSYYKITKSNILYGETGSLEIFLIDQYGNNMGKNMERLQELQKTTTVKAGTYTMTFEKITSSLSLLYKYTFNAIGTFAVSVNSNSKTVKANGASSFVVSYDTIDMDKSLFKILLDKEYTINPGSTTTVQSTVQVPKYTLYLYNSDGTPVKAYDKSTPITLKMSDSDGNEYNLNVDKQTNSVKFTYDDTTTSTFSNLVSGTYPLTLTVGGNSYVYYLNLVGEEGSEDASNDPDYDISKTSFSTTNIDGIAGEKYTVNVEFRAADGKRWNWKGDTSKFKVTNSKGYDATKLIINIIYGAKKGQFLFEITQNPATNPNPNSLTITYDGKELPKKISDNTRPAGFAGLVLLSDCKTLDGTVDELPVIKYKAVDKYGNEITGLKSDSYTKDFLNGLTVGKSVDGVKLTTNNYISGGYIYVNYKTKIPTTVQVTSSYCSDKCTYSIGSGDIDLGNTYAQLKVVGEEASAGGEYSVIIMPQDQYYNELDWMDEDILPHFKVYYQLTGADGQMQKKDISNTCKLAHVEGSEITVNDEQTMVDEGATNSIVCTTTISQTGNIYFHAEYDQAEMECRSCYVSIFAGKFDKTNTQFKYTGTNTIMTTTEATEVDSSTAATFDATFMDQFKNIITSATATENVVVTGKLEGTDIKMCVSKDGADRLITICPSSNGDDNMNKWYYLTNGRYYVVFNVDGTDFRFPIELTGKYGSGSSKPTDWTKVSVTPASQTLVAGKTGTVNVELRDSDGVRKNYWYASNTALKVSFEKDSQCTSTVDRGSLPGQYKINFSCKKVVDSNHLYVTIDGNKVTQNSQFSITAGSAYTVETQNTSGYTVDGTKYTSTTKPTNDDQFTFSFKLKDSYGNYIKESDFSKTGAELYSELSGKDETKYTITYDSATGTYKVTDKIPTLMTGNTWYVETPASGKKYSYTYTKQPGKATASTSDYSLNSNTLVVKETSYVDVLLRDALNDEIGKVAGNLETAKSLVSVVGKSKSGNVNYVFDSIQGNKLRYKYTYNNKGDYEVAVTYNGGAITTKNNSTLSVDYQGYSIAKNKLDKVINGTSTLMQTGSQSNINNVYDNPTYTYTLYNEGGEKITDIDENLNIKCTMVFGDYSWEYTAAKTSSGFTCTPPLSNKEFASLPRGQYDFIVGIEGKNITYPLYLIGDANSGDASPSSTYNTKKTYFSTTNITGIAGQTYEIMLEFRANDGLRWNYEGNLNEFSFSNSYGLDSTQLKTSVRLGEKKGQFIVSITQNKATTGQADNQLVIKYANEDLTSKVYLKIKCGPLSKLTYESGLRDGTVEDLPVLKFVPYDAYGNLYTDLFDTSKTTQDTLNKLTSYASTNGALTTNNYVSNNKYLNVQYGTTKNTQITVKSPYMAKEYSYKITSGKINADQSDVKVTPSPVAGGTHTVEVQPKDQYGNEIPTITPEDGKDYVVYYKVTGSDGTTKTVDITDKCKVVDGKYTCSAQVTEAGDITYHVEYKDKETKCTTCNAKVKEGELDFSKTTGTYVNDGTTLKTTGNNVKVSSVPEWELTFHDKYGNVITDPTVTKNYEINSKITGNDVKLCSKDEDNKKIVTVCPATNGDDNVNKWSYTTDGPYTLQVANKEGKTLNYGLDLTDGYKEGSSGPLDATRTEFKPVQITTVAGQEGTIFMELKSNDGQRKNYWYPNPEDHIKIDFQNDDNCQYSFTKAEKPGQYNIHFVCTKKDNLNICTVTIDGTQARQNLGLTIKEAAPKYSKVYNMNGEEITKQDMGTVSVEDTFQFKQVIYDQYNNVVTPGTYTVDKTQYQFNTYGEKKGSGSYGYSLTHKAEGDIIITLKSEIAGLHSMTNSFFPLKAYNVTFTHGPVSADQCEIVVPNPESTVGEDTKVYVIPYDAHGNYIDANEFIGTGKNPFELFYDTEDGTKKVPITDYKVEEYNGKNVLVYEPEFTESTKNTIHGDIDGTPLQCVSCVIESKSGPMDFTKSVVDRYDNGKNEFTSLVDGIVEKNAAEEPIYRLYPKDTYGNKVDTIPSEVLTGMTAYLENKKDGSKYELKLNNEKMDGQEYAEFVINDIVGEDVTYATLVGGDYSLVFKKGDQQIDYDITLFGTDGDKNASNKPVDPQNTYINEENLEFEAGDSGTMIIELRTEDNLRKNFWEGYEFTVESCDPNDKSFKYSQEKAGNLGVFVLTVETTKSNTYPTYEECPLTIKVNGETVEDLHPVMKVTPASLAKTEIEQKYWKTSTSSKELKDGSADTNYVFEVKSYDKYGNLMETDQDLIGLTVSQKGEEVELTAENVKDTGAKKYSAPTTKSGTYTVSTNLNKETGKSYLENDSTFIVEPGKIVPSDTDVVPVIGEIEAGDKPEVVINAYDKNGNPVDGEDYKDKYEVVLKDEKGQTYPTKPTVDPEDPTKVIYTTIDPVEIAGELTADIIYKETGEDVPSDITIDVTPSEPKAENSVLSQINGLGSLNEYKDGDTIQGATGTPLEFNLTLYDEYGNYVPNIPDNVEITGAKMTGNDMEPITFDVEKKDGYYYIDFSKNPEAMDIYQHLVSGDGYEISFDVKTPTGSEEFNYDISIASGKDDTGYGNGPYEPSKCTINPEEATFTAGDYYTTNLEVRTAKGLLFNNEVDPETIVIRPEVDDPTFSYKIEKAGSNNGIYAITVYSEKQGDNKLKVYLPKDGKEELAGEFDYTVTAQKTPVQEETQIVSKPPATINSDDYVEMTFKLADKFGNVMEGRTDVIDGNYLNIQNNGDYITDKCTRQLLEDGVTFKVSCPAIYPPREMNMNVIYNDGEKSVILFPEEIKSTIYSEPDFGSVDILSDNLMDINAGEVLDVRARIYDNKGVCVDGADYSSSLKVQATGPLESETTIPKKQYSFKKVNNPELDCQNEYQIITTDDDAYTAAGTYNIKITANGDKTIGAYTQTCHNLGYSLTGFKLETEEDFDPEHVKVTDQMKFTITGTDIYGNKVDLPLDGKITYAMTIDGKKVPIETRNAETNLGTLETFIDMHKVGDAQLHIYYEGKEIQTINGGEALPKLHFEPGPCSSENGNTDFDTSKLDFVLIDEETDFTFNCYDIYGNKITEGGEDFTASGYLMVGDTQTNFPETVVDNGDGSYTIKFTPTRAGDYVIGVFNNDEKYGDDVKFTVNKNPCSGSTPYLCPNVKKCVKSTYECIEGNGNCPINKPFYCPVNGVNTCVKSQTECDCPIGYKQCSYMKYCVPENRYNDMCLQVAMTLKRCRKLNANYILFDDGICRVNNNDLKPSQIVCPIGQVLCADLSCRDNYGQCDVSDYCPSMTVRCVDQTCQSTNEYCPSTITCKNPAHVVCPDGTCVENEISCNPLNVCTGDRSYRCANGLCVSDKTYCPHNIACGNGLVLCEDNICRQSCN